MGTVTKRFDVVAGRKYESRGETKTHWINVGEAAEWDDGGITLRLHAVPVGNWFDGTLKLFERKEREQSSPRQSSRPQREQPASGGGSFDDETIPF